MSPSRETFLCMVAGARPRRPRKGPVPLFESRINARAHARRHTVDVAPFIPGSCGSEADGALVAEVLQTCITRLQTSTGAASAPAPRSLWHTFLGFSQPLLERSREHARQPEAPRPGGSATVDKAATYRLQMHFIFIHRFQSGTEELRYGWGKKFDLSDFSACFGFEIDLSLRGKKSLLSCVFWIWNPGMPRTKSPSMSGTRCGETRRRSEGAAGLLSALWFPVMPLHFRADTNAHPPTFHCASAVNNGYFRFPWKRVRLCVWHPAGWCDLNIRLQAAVNTCKSETSAWKARLYCFMTTLFFLHEPTSTDLSVIKMFNWIKNRDKDPLKNRLNHLSLM